MTTERFRFDECADHRHSCPGAVRSGSYVAICSCPCHKENSDDPR